MDVSRVNNGLSVPKKIEHGFSEVHVEDQNRFSMLLALNDDDSKEESNSHNVISSSSERIRSIIDDTPAVFKVSENLNASAEKPWYENNFYNQVYGNETEYEKISEKVGVDGNLIKAIAYMETTHGYYDGFPVASSFATSHRPMNIKYSVWKDLANQLGYSEKDVIQNDKANIHIGAVILKRISDRLENPTIEGIASIYNFSGRETVNDYGMRVKEIYESKLWKEKAEPPQVDTSIAP